MNISYIYIIFLCIALGSAVVGAGCIAFAVAVTEPSSFARKIFLSIGICIGLAGWIGSFIFIDWAKNL